MFGIGTPPDGGVETPTNCLREGQRTAITTLRRPPSYSDSFFILHGAAEHSVQTQGSLNGGRSRASTESDEGQTLLRQLLQQVRTRQTEQLPMAPRAYLFFIKSAIHIFLVSVFETIFFFQYVSKREDNGVLDTINTYYLPLVDTCPSWSNETRQVISILLKDIDYRQIEASGSLSNANRHIDNQGLLNDSLVSSAVCFVFMVGGMMLLMKKKVPVRWWVIGVENISMVVLLGIYEYLFFSFVIYKYATISTPELNSYIVKGLASCVGLPTFS